ncbi:hypothetical protein [Anaerovorax odorimutans]|uniref:hypothetical protein n=1 Tax=Anaerovorax odorimutans TaxID=109327 RepID=UPI0004092284|nr:hypothetical protein [Anaerovorax odorimutans]
MVNELKISGYIIKNISPIYSDNKDKEKAEQELIKNILKEYNNLGEDKTLI